MSTPPTMVSYVRTVRDCLKQRDVGAALSWATTALEQSGDPDWHGRPSEWVSPGHVGGQTQGARPQLGELFVRGQVPAGPLRARLAWARSMDNCAVVVEVHVRPSGAVDVAWALELAGGDRAAGGSAELEEFLKQWRRP